MSIFRANPDERFSKKQLSDMEAMRLKFAMKSLARQSHPEKALYIQREGGFTGIGVNNATLYLITGPAPDCDEDFSMRPLQYSSASLLPVIQEIKGMGGMFGFGEKGGAGLRLVIEAPSVVELVIIPGLTCFVDVILEDDTLFSTTEDLKNNVFGYMRPQSYSSCHSVLIKWLGILHSISV